MVGTGVATMAVPHGARAYRSWSPAVLVPCLLLPLSTADPGGKPLETSALSTGLQVTSSRTEGLVWPPTV